MNTLNRRVTLQHLTWPAALLLIACSGKVQVESTGSAGGGTGGQGGQGGSTGSAGGVEQEYIQYCQEHATCSGQGSSFDEAYCIESAKCDDMLVHTPGSPLFNCLSKGACLLETCLLDVYSEYALQQPTPTAEKFQDQCVAALQSGCTVFEDFCVAGALFNDDGLALLTSCFDLPTCQDVKDCALAIYAPCTAWAYQLKP